jgi:hypothetical protein
MPALLHRSTSSVFVAPADKSVKSDEAVGAGPDLAVASALDPGFHRRTSSLHPNCCRLPIPKKVRLFWKDSISSKFKTQRLRQDTDDSGPFSTYLKLIVFDPARIGGSMILIDIGTHAHHLGAYVTGLDLESLCADVGHVVPGRQVDDYAIALASLFQWRTWLYVGHERGKRR